ncbi:ABC transporter permease subunit [Alteromonadaceae bacterium BrNp21-10]|nr:ABC transporter permease subunit [Alteromonadaceae bacterium BrNp21-10]
MARSKLYIEEHYPSPLKHTWNEFQKSHVSLTGLWLLCIFLVIVIFAPGLAPFDPNKQQVDILLLPPSWDSSGSIQYLFGTDSLGRDLLSRVIYGSRVTLGISILLVLISMLIGLTLGAFAGMGHGLRSSILNHFLDSIMVIPTLLIAIIIVAILGTGLWNCMLAITLALIPRFIHITRNMVRAECNKEYVTAARLDGAGRVRILFDSILPNMIENLVVQGTFALSAAILDISALGFLSLGASATTPELGSMLSDGMELAYVAPWSIALPGCAILLMLVAINLVGDGLRSSLRHRLQH